LQSSALLFKEHTSVFDDGILKNPENFVASIGLAKHLVQKVEALAILSMN